MKTITLLFSVLAATLKASAQEAITLSTSASPTSRGPLSSSAAVTTAPVISTRIIPSGAISSIVACYTSIPGSGPATSSRIATFQPGEPYPTTVTLSTQGSIIKRQAVISSSSFAVPTSVPTGVDCYIEYLEGGNTMGYEPYVFGGTSSSASPSGTNSSEGANGAPNDLEHSTIENESSGNNLKIILPIVLTLGVLAGLLIGFFLYSRKNKNAIAANQGGKDHSWVARFPWNRNDRVREMIQTEKV